MVNDKTKPLFARHFYICLTFFLDGEHAPAPGSFLFSFLNNDDLPPFKSPLKDGMAEYAIWRGNDRGPTFGNGYDMRVPHDAQPKSSYSQFGRTYQLPPGYTYPSPEAQSLLAGSFQFSPSEVEVLFLI